MEKELKFLLYTTPQEDVKIDVAIKDETIWLTQKAMAMLFGVQVPAVNKHLKNIFEQGELDEKMVVSILEITTQHGAIAGKTQNIETQFYNLDAIISVGYRINSAKATQFRIWATKILKEFITNLTTWKNSPNGRILKSDVLVAKNYLQENQIRRLERAVTGYGV